VLASKQLFDLIPAPPILDEETTVRLRVVIARLSRRLRPTEAGTAAGLSPTRISVLLTIARSEEIRLSDLAETEGLNPTMLSRVISDFVAAGLVRRDSDDGDRRAAWVRATSAGRRLAERIRRERTTALNGAMDGLSDGERRLVEEALPALERLAERLKDRRV
jgi:DNA-binding MarR family transcriptional regulator